MHPWNLPHADGGLMRSPSWARIHPEPSARRRSSTSPSPPRHDFVDARSAFDAPKGCECCCPISGQTSAKPSARRRGVQTLTFTFTPTDLRLPLAIRPPPNPERTGPFGTPKVDPMCPARRSKARSKSHQEHQELFAAPKKPSARRRVLFPPAATRPELKARGNLQHAEG